MGFDKPIYVQFSRWFTGVLQGDFGQSIFFHKPVLQVIRDRAEVSLFIAVLSMALIIVTGIPIGVISAVWYNSYTDQTCSGASMLAASMPTFWLGLNLMLIFSVVLGWLPSSGFPVRRREREPRQPQVPGAPLRHAGRAQLRPDHPPDPRQHAGCAQGRLRDDGAGQGTVRGGGDD